MTLAQLARPARTRCCAHSRRPARVLWLALVTLAACRASDGGAREERGGTKPPVSVVRPPGSDCPDDRCPEPVTAPPRGTDASDVGSREDGIGARDATEGPVDGDPDDGGLGVDLAPGGAADAPSADPLRRGLVLWLPLDDAPGTGSPQDSSGHGNRTDARGLEVTRTWVPGRVRGGFDFAAGGAAGHLEVQGSPSINRIGRALTIAAWLWRPAAGGGAIVSRRGSGPLGMLYLFAVQPTGRLTFFANERPGYRLQMISSAAVPGDSWVHVAVTLSGTEARIYIDGVSVAARNYALPLPNDLSPVLVGASSGGAGARDFFRDRLDEVMLYERALMPAEIARLAAGDLPP